jgi:hypothetical protein
MPNREITILDGTILCEDCGEMVIELAQRVDIDLLADHNGERKERQVGESTILCECCEEIVGEEEIYYILTADRYVARMRVASSRKLNGFVK